MHDMLRRRKQCLAEASDCEMIALLATDPIKRETFKRLAEQFKDMAADLDMTMEVLEKARL